MAELRVPKLNTNDGEYLLVEWLVEDGAQVHEDDLVALVETSKAAEELAADATGVLRHGVVAGAWCRPDQVIATIGGEAAAAQAAPPAPRLAAGRDGPPLVTAPAQAFADEHGITGDQLRELGLKVVRKADLERLLGHVRDLPKVQRAVARAVELSHRSIPAAYLAVRMDLAGAIEHARAETRAVRRPVGLAEIFVQAVAGLHERFPLFFATLDGDQVRLSRTADIGVTLDLGEGLYVPVLRDAARRTTKELASALMRYRLAATTGDFRPSDLSGATFVVTLHTEGGVVMAIPFVFPGTTCALAVTAPREGSAADIGLAYDHRLINGRDAALFMNALKAAVEGLS
ncbi:2-oxo acid dehydrogenase subunit E2 [Nonomuraea africana]|uniref:Dihydrolipoamide acetyltransferase component of pyruvate dehydrogenase complex n=1 Tax=Nonomuraea africana TaxID=46171 RepID=A0ABR9KKE9_9ACTN|nr:2-oxo acid dehydrogenase subunit E2 [Nonomuraea africana]MBE1562450.1 2-oxoglutarate dehydrogenase E2 component (dihydrolipoamide succinyltransferase) [Nonomuraea africana]